MDITRQSYGHNQYLNCRGGLSTRVSASPSRFSVSLKRIQRSILKLAVSTIKTQTPAEDNPTLRWRPFSFCFLFGLHFDLGAKTFFQSCSEHLFFSFWSSLEFESKERPKRTKPWIFPKSPPNFSRILNVSGHGFACVLPCNILQF